MDQSAQPQVPVSTISTQPTLPNDAVQQPLPAQPSTVSAPALAQPMVQAASTVQVQQAGMPARAKESGPVIQEVTSPIEVVGSDAIEKEPLPPEVASWMEKVNRDNSGEKPAEIVVADKTAQAPTGNYSSQPVFVLPLGEPEYKQGLHHGVDDSVRWLAEWCKKIVKKLGEQTIFYTSQ